MSSFMGFVFGSGSDEDQVNKEIHQLDKVLLCELAHSEHYRSFVKLMSILRNLRTLVDNNDNVHEIYTGHYKYCMEVLDL